MRTRKRFGQHFLEPAWADKVVEAIAPQREDVFLEIGPGPGILTMRLAPRVAHLTAIEVDRDFVRELSKALPGNVTLISGDVLEADLADLPGLQRQQPIRVAGNLPYNISSPILFRLLEQASQRPLFDATVMLQREVGDRVLATPGTPDYGVLSILIQWRAEVSKLLLVPPGAFRPPPEVHSMLLRLRFRPPVHPCRDPELLERMVRAMFTRRRKTLTNALAGFGREVSVDPGAALREAGIDGRRRPETLEIVEIARLANVFAGSPK